MHNPNGMMPNGAESLPLDARGWRADLDEAARAYAADRMSAGRLAAHFRRAAGERADLPARYRAVLERLLQPLEASALFSEESCSFSRTDLARSLQEWVAATERLPGS